MGLTRWGGLESLATPFRRATGLHHAPMRKVAGYSGVAPDFRLRIRRRILQASHTMSHTGAWSTLVSGGEHT
jgi:hypothetical protein